MENTPPLSPKRNLRCPLFFIGLMALLWGPVMAETRVYNPNNLADPYTTEYGGGPHAPLPASGSLREAIALANTFALPEDEVVINLQSGATYKLERSTVFTLQGTDLNSEEGGDFGFDQLHGDLDIKCSMIINGNGATIDAQRLARIFHIRGNNDANNKLAVTLRNLTLKGGGYPTLDSGGAIRVSGEVQLLLENVRFEDHQITGNSNVSGPLRGGAIYVTENASSGVRLLNCHFENCRVISDPGVLSEVQGGAIYLQNGGLLVENTIFHQCHARQNAQIEGKEARGGAIYAAGGGVKFVESRFEENSVLTPPGSSVFNNGQAGLASEGGAVYVGGSVTVFEADKTVFRKNTAKAGRGAHNLTSTPAATGGNGGPARGGAVYMAPGSNILFVFKECLLEHNIALGGTGGDVIHLGHFGFFTAGRGGDAQGGSIYTRRGRLDLTKTTFNENVAMAGDGGEVARGWGGMVGGKGGNAAGGAIYATSETVSVSLTGEIDIINAEAEKIYSSALVYNNVALGGRGKPGMHNNDSNEGGEGGNAQGGAFVVLCPTFTLNGVLAKDNSAQGGTGADGLDESLKVIVLGGESGGVNYPPEARLSRGGNNGYAYGGAIYTSAGEATILNSCFARNQATGYRMLGTVIHKVGSENNGVWFLQLPDVAVPTAAGRGGGFEGAVEGGRGGTASGGAIYGASGHLYIDVSSFASNQATGGNGGAGGAVYGSGWVRLGGKGGNGGEAYGGALSLNTGQTYEIRQSVLLANLAMGGRGGSGGRGGDKPQDSPMLGGDGGAGGKGGNAFGGAIYSLADSNSPQSECAVESCYIAGNKVLGGDGAFGGNGGIGEGGSMEYDEDEHGGGFGGIGGDGGTAQGGGIYAYQVYLRKSTLDQNLIAAGWGGQGGHGNLGTIFGGNGGAGGHGGEARGGGLCVIGAVQHSSRVELSTISYNRVYSGTGGTGGLGGPSLFVGGHGGNGGSAQGARGGGIFIAGQTTPTNNVQIVNATVAGNLVEGGDRGFRGLPMANAEAFDYATVPTRYQAAASAPVQIGSTVYSGPPVKGGSLSYVTDQYGYPGGILPTSESYYVPPVTLGNPSSTLKVNERVDLISFATGSAVGLTGLGAITSIGAIHAGLLVLSSAVQTFGSGGAVMTSFTMGAGSAFAVVGVYTGIGFAVFTTAMVVSRLVTAFEEYGISQEAFAWFLGSPGEVTRNSLMTLIQGAWHPNSDVDVPDPQPGFYGNWGTAAPVEGSGIFGKATLQSSLISNNKGQRLARPTTQKVINSVAVVEYTENVENPPVYEFHGTGVSNGGLFVGSAEGLTINGSTDQVGTLQNPLDAKIATKVGDHGGDVPTLKLLPTSPARHTLTNTTPQEAQNGYFWEANTERDIGAWGGPPNRPPVAVNKNIRVRRGETAIFSLQEVIGQQIDPDNDFLSLVGYDRYWGDSSWTTITAEFEPSNITFFFTPPDNFPPIGTAFHFEITDGEFNADGYVMVQILPDPSECPESLNERWLKLNGAGDYVSLPESAKTDHNFTGPFTVEFWYVSHRTEAPPQHEAFITKGDSAWRVQRYGVTDKVTFDVSGLEPLQLPSVSDVADGQLHHIAAVYDGQYKYLYVDGQLEAYAAVSGAPATNTQPVWIGANSERSGRNTLGAFDEVRIWNRALDHAEIRSAATRRVDVYSDGLLTWYPLEESGGPAVYNYAANGVDEPGFLVWQDQMPQRVLSVLQNYATVLGQHLFYNDSEFDGQDPTANAADDNAIAADKVALLPGETVGLMAGPATLPHRSFYQKGINGIMIDVVGLAQPGSLSLDDFIFQQGDGGDPAIWNPSTWPAAPTPQALLVREGAGPCDSHRVMLVWDAADSGTDHAALTRGWLRVTLKANGHTGLLSDEVFYFGHGAGTSANTLPVFSGYSFSVPMAQSATVSLAKLLARASDADGEALSVTAVSPGTQGGTVTLGQHTLTYTPPSGFAGTDSFEVTISDGSGGEVTGTVTVEVTQPNGFFDEVNNLAFIDMNENGEVRLLFYGIPGRSYILQFSTDLINWVDKETLTAAPNGRLEFTDDPPQGGEISGFYRTITPP